MVQFIITLVFFISVGGVLFLIARSLPRITEEEVTGGRTETLAHWITAEIPEKLDVVFNSFLGKFLRRLKVFLLRFDNVLTERLKKIRPENGNGKRIDFSNLSSSSSVAENEKSE